MLWEDDFSVRSYCFCNGSLYAFHVAGGFEVVETFVEFAGIEKIILVILVHHFGHFFHEWYKQAEYFQEPNRQYRNIMRYIHFRCKNTDHIPGAHPA